MHAWPAHGSMDGKKRVVLAREKSAREERGSASFSIVRVAYNISHVPLCVSYAVCLALKRPLSVSLITDLVK